MLPFLLLAFAITWGCELPFVLARAGVAVPAPIIMPLMVVAAIGPALAAMLLTPRAQRRQLWRWRVRGNGGWIALALLSTPLAMLLAALIAHPHAWIGLDLAGPTLGIALLSPVGEELGWRAYLLPRLDPDAHPLRASVVVGVAWCAWHIPYDGWPSPWMWLRLVALSIIFTQLWQASDRSLAVAVAAHLSIHLTRIFRVAEGTPLAAVAVVTAIAAVAALRPAIRR